MKLKYLEYFLTIAKLGNMTHAAQQLYLSQPNLTVAIKRLEEELNITLFERHHKSVSLTPEGARFYKQLFPIIQDLHTLLQEIKSINSDELAPISIGIPPMIGSFVMRPLLNFFKQTYPMKELTIVEDGSIGLQQKLSQGDLDIAIIIITNELPKNLASIPLRSVEYKACVPKSHTLANHTTITYDELQSESLIMMQLDSFHRQHIMKHLAASHVTPHIAMSSNHIERNLDMTVANNHISFLLTPSPFHREDINLISLKPPIVATVAIVYKNNKSMDTLAKQILMAIGSNEN
ncbi:MAG: LysR family transcriptional regulator [Veillonella caviae]|uniref:LysR family transcriptional regulator n=1 Tax=Veillonella caviae TaxID=248316 RepID=UPI002A908676|nr:LysR family transcriptional regulator [Veillonella caviae]MDY5482062.1 LysR family transcriptional regulator [Veillonella caviae]